MEHRQSRRDPISRLVPMGQAVKRKRDSPANPCPNLQERGTLKHTSSVARLPASVNPDPGCPQAGGLRARPTRCGVGSGFSPSPPQPAAAAPTTKEGGESSGDRLRWFFAARLDAFLRAGVAFS